MNNTPGPWQARRWIVRVDESMGSGFELYGDIGAGQDEVYLGELICSLEVARLIESAPELLDIVRRLHAERIGFGLDDATSALIRMLLARIDGGDA